MNYIGRMEEEEGEQVKKNSDERSHEDMEKNV